MPKVSVIIPAYNQEDFIERAINSVLSQSFKDLELIVVDDGSVDNTGNIVLSLQKKDDRIRYFWQKNFGGPSGPKNVGIKNAKGDYMAFLDGDDEWSYNKLKEQINALQLSNRNDIGLVSCAALVVDNQTGRILSVHNLKNKPNFSDFLLTNPLLSTSSALIKKEVFVHIGFFDENLKILDDWEMWLRILQKYDYLFINKPLFRYYVHEKNVTKVSGMLSHTRELEYITLKYQDYFKKDSKIYSKRLRVLGSRFLAWGDKEKGKKHLKNSIKYDCLNLLSYFYLILVCLFSVKVYRFFWNIKSCLIRFFKKVL